MEPFQMSVAKIFILKSFFSFITQISSEDSLIRLLFKTWFGLAASIDGLTVFAVVHYAIPNN